MGGARPRGDERATADGRMGYLLYRRAFTRRLIIPLIGRSVFAVGRADSDLLAALPPMLDRIDPGSPTASSAQSS